MERLERAGRSPLIRAVAMPMHEAHAAWREWRASADIDRLSAEAFHVIPVLGGRLGEWLDGDPAAGVFRGIVRRAWTETQLRLSAFRRIASALEQAGCGPVVAGGSLAVCLLNQSPESVRSISDIRLIVRRDSLARSVEVIEAAGWRLSGPLPPAEGLDWTAAAYFSRQGMSLVLQWRVLPVPQAKVAAVEAEFLDHRQIVDGGAVPVWAPGPEHAMLAALCGRLDFDADMVPWQVDAALLPLDGIVWRRWRAMAEMFAPEAFDRLDEMRGLGLRAPKMRRKLPAPPSRMRKLYRTWRSRGGRFARRLLRAAHAGLRSRP